MNKIGMEQEKDIKGYSTRNSVTRLGIYWTLGKFLKALATINFPKSPTQISHILRQFS